MATSSIYQRVCPACATLVETGLKQCSCGYSFGAQNEDNESLPEDQVVQDEELVKEYIDARISQAMLALQLIQTALIHDPKDIKKANNLMQAFSDMRELRTELEAQTAKIIGAKNAARAARLERGMKVAPDTNTMETSATSLQSTAEFRAAQTAKAENIMKAAGIDTKKCLKCHAVLPERAALCFCGFTFAHGSDGTMARLAGMAATPQVLESDKTP